MMSLRNHTKRALTRITNNRNVHTPRSIPVMHSKTKSHVVEPPHMNLCINLDSRAKLEQKTFEQVMRGHSAMVDGSLVQRSIPMRVRLKAAGLDETQKEKLNSVGMKESFKRAHILLNMLQKEIQNAANMRSNLVKIQKEASEKDDENENDKEHASKEVVPETKTITEESSNDVDNQNRELVEQGLLYSHPGAAGPSIQMYDLVLDALSIQASPQNVKVATELLDDVLDRYKALSAAKEYYESRETKDCLSDEELSTFTALSQIDISLYAPTAVSFNAVIRAAANAHVDPHNEQERDLTLSSAFMTLYNIHDSDCVHRNSATFTYMLQVVEKLIPPSRSRGNIARGLFQKACDDGVVDNNVLNALEKISGGGGIDFDSWILQITESKEFPQKWRRNSKLRMHRHGGGLY